LAARELDDLTMIAQTINAGHIRPTISDALLLFSCLVSACLVEVYTTASGLKPRRHTPPLSLPAPFVAVTRSAIILCIDRCAYSHTYLCICVGMSLVCVYTCKYNINMASVLEFIYIICMHQIRYCHEIRGLCTCPHPLSVKIQFDHFDTTLNYFKLYHGIRLLHKCVVCIQPFWQKSGKQWALQL